jgi:hypothetical protein
MTCSASGKDISNLQLNFCDFEDPIKKEGDIMDLLSKPSLPLFKGQRQLIIPEQSEETLKRTNPER